MSATITYQQLHTESLLTNFKTVDKFIKDFGLFQRKINDMDKTQKSMQLQLSNFKVSTQNSFANLNEVVESRAGLQKGQVNLADNDEIKEIKKSFNEIKKFITENTRDQHEAQTTRDQEGQENSKMVEKKFVKYAKELEIADSRGQGLEVEIRELKLKLATKSQLDKTRFEMKENEKILLATSDNVAQIQVMLDKLNVTEFKQTIDEFRGNMTDQLSEAKRKLKLKTDISDTLKLEEMMLNLINYTYEHSSKKLADKSQTKKALVFLQKRMNKLMMTLYGEEEGDKQAILATKGWKCVSCTKDLGELEGKLDKYKPWSIFPTKESPVKDRYSGFGAGFQSVVETTVTKKGIEPSYDEKGRMTTPYNLTREVQTNLLKPSQSQSKMNSGSAHKSNFNMRNKPMQMETNFMGLYGRNNEADIDLKDQYGKKYNGLLAYLNVAYQQNQYTES